MFAHDGQPLPEADSFDCAQDRLRPAAGPDRHAERVEVPRVEYEKLSDDRLGEPSAAIRARAASTRDQQELALARRWMGIETWPADAAEQEKLRKTWRCQRTACVFHLCHCAHGASLAG